MLDDDLIASIQADNDWARAELKRNGDLRASRWSTVAHNVALLLKDRALMQKRLIAAEARADAAEAEVAMLRRRAEQREQDGH